jgi:hypothetical protein
MFVLVCRGKLLLPGLLLLNVSVLTGAIGGGGGGGRNGRTGVADEVAALGGATQLARQEEDGYATGGKEKFYGQRHIGGLTEKVEGCFDRFDSEFAVELGRDNINNHRCQAICTDKGYALSATGLIDTCFCGNDYPSSFHRVDTARCDLPCNPDKGSCFSFACCGSRDGNFFTVSWSGEQDILLQLLRQLSHDYRFNNPTFRRKVEGTFSGRTTFRLMPESPVGGKKGHGGGHWKLRDGQQTPMFLSLGDGCPMGWTLHDRWCYKTNWATPMTYPRAVRECQADGAELVTVTSQPESAFIVKLQGGCQGWLGSKVEEDSPLFERTRDRGHSRRLEPSGGVATSIVNPVANTSGVEPSSTLDESSAIGLSGDDWSRQEGAEGLWVSPEYRAWDSSAVLPGGDERIVETPTFGSRGGQRYDDFAQGIRKVKSVIVGHSDGGIESLHFIYSTHNGDDYTGKVLGQTTARRSGRSPAVQSRVDMADDEELISIAVATGSGSVQGMAFKTRSRGGVEVAHGPFGRVEGPGITVGDYMPDYPVVGAFVYKDLLSSRIRALGLYLVVKKKCSRMDGKGNWTTTECSRSELEWDQYICEKPVAGYGAGCDMGWIPYESSCYMKDGDYNLTWVEARARCQNLGSALVSVSSDDENSFVQGYFGPYGGLIGLYKAYGKQEPWVWDAFWNGPKSLAALLAPSGLKDERTDRFSAQIPRCFHMKV